MSFASYQAMAGVAGRGLQLLLRHKDARMTMRYSHVSDAYLKAARLTVWFLRRISAKASSIWYALIT